MRLFTPRFSWTWRGGLRVSQGMLFKPHKIARSLYGYASQRASRWGFRKLFK